MLKAENVAIMYMGGIWTGEQFEEAKIIVMQNIDLNYLIMVEKSKNESFKIFFKEIVRIEKNQSNVIRIFISHLFIKYVDLRLNEFSSFYKDLKKYWSLHHSQSSEIKVNKMLFQTFWGKLRTILLHWIVFW